MFDLPFTPEDVQKQWNEVTSFERENENPQGSEDTFPKFTENLERIKAKQEGKETPKEAPKQVAPAQ